MKKIIFSLLVSCAIASAAFTVDKNTATAAVRDFLTNKDARAIELIFKKGSDSVNIYLLSDTLTSIAIVDGVIFDGGGLGITLKEPIKLLGDESSELGFPFDMIEAVYYANGLLSFSFNDKFSL
ncbi:MAG: hypothetical protein P1P63_05650 [Treponemataceae bacterium]